MRKIKEESAASIRKMQADAQIEIKKIEKIAKWATAGTAAAVFVGSIFLIYRQESKRRCNSCITSSTARFGSIDDACSTSTATCKSYHFNVADHCQRKCSDKRVMQPMNSYLHQILKSQSESFFRLIQNANSIEELQPAVAFVNELKDIEGKTLSRFRIRKTLSTKVEQAIQVKRNQLNGLAPTS